MYNLTYIFLVFCYLFSYLYWEEEKVIVIILFIYFLHVKKYWSTYNLIDLTCLQHV